MPRPLRIHLPGAFYHVTLRGNHRQNIFNHARERSLLDMIVARALAKHRAGLHGFCWMTNHLHFLVRVGDTPLGRLMQQIASEYARAFQANLATTGHLFENRYYATLVDTDSYLLETLRYVHQNPVRGGITSRVDQYRWSSHRDYAGGPDNPWVTTDFVLRLFSPVRARAVALYRAFVERAPALQVAEELAALEKGVALLGDPEFVARHAPARRPAVSLENIVDAACRHFAVTAPELRSSSRTAKLVSARAWVASAATHTGAANLTEVARALNRDESTLRHAVKTRRSQDADGLALEALLRGAKKD